MGKDKKVTIGYWYYFGIHMGLGRGPIDELLEIKVGDKTAWTGSVGSNTSFTINSPNLFGGEKGEGGIQGTLDVLMGADDQVIGGGLPGMMQRMGVLMPQFRGVATLFYNGKVCALNPYPKAWKMRVRRAIRGWENNNPWYPERAVVPLAGGKIKAMNPAHMLVEGLTNTKWGRGLDSGRLNLDTYRVAADTLYNEGFGLCMRWTRSGSVTEFIQQIIDTIGAIQEVNRRTGLIELRLVRDDYDAASLPLFTYGNGLLAVDDIEVSSQDSSVNQMIVKYHDPITDEDMTTPPVDNLGSIQANGGTNSMTKEYLAVPTAEIASRLAIRDLQASMGFLRKMTLHLDRRGYPLSPGSVFRVSIPERGISSMVMRVGKLQDGQLDSGTITVTCVEDVFGLPQSSYVQPQPPGWVPPDQVARDPVTKVLREASWRDVITNLNAGGLQSISNTSSFITGLALKPQGLALAYEFWTAPYASGYTDRDAGDWVPSATLGSDMALSGVDTVVTLANFLDFTDFTVGSGVLIDDEEMVIVSVDANNAQLTLGRGALDSVPARHVSGSRMWLYTDAMAFDQTDWSQNVQMYAKYLSFTNGQKLDISQAGALTISTIARQAKPYPPGNVRINDTRYYEVQSVSDVLNLSWAHRDRKSQDDQYFSHTYGSIGPETGVTYTVRVRRPDNQVVRQDTGITGTTWAYTSAMAAQDGALGSFIIELLSVRNGIESWQSYRMPITRAGLGLNLGQYLGGSV